ncbi:SAM dependent methyltransferase, putative [Plasmodium malariae]|uniref:SAM dependent methyltransferase, putative n=2 Tax=Plasmodium malariae TaxID=5858 RepID=A0A1D3TE58_PLAMA|nr:SAM dependent methyltransferase, putative [Plasmodium malariae]SCP03176.1 SAM dependent methyltransferase, putative [Plasmodium malariae]
MHRFNCNKFPVGKNFKTIIYNYHIFKRKISDICESKIISLNKSKEYDKFKIYRNNIYNNICENQILQGVKVHKLDPDGYGEIAIYATRQNNLFFLKFFLLIPDEQVNLKVLDINKKKKKITFQILCKTKKSKYEIIPRCEYFSNCGGCMYQHINYNFERQSKKNLLISLCEKYNIHLLVSSKDYLQNDHYFCKIVEQNEGELLDISKIKREYTGNDLEEEEGQHEELRKNIQEELLVHQSYKKKDSVDIENKFQNEEAMSTHYIGHTDEGNYSKSHNDNSDVHKKQSMFNSEIEKINLAKLYEIIYADEYHYRNKTSINFSVTDHLSIGYFKKHSYEICDINKCYIHDEHIQNAFVEIKKEINENFKKNNIYIFNKINNNGYLKSVSIKLSIYNSEKQILINFTGYSIDDKARKHLINIANNLALKDKSIKGVLYNVETNKLKQIKSETVLYGQNYIYHTFDNYTYKVGANTFFQSNKYLNTCIIQIIFKLIKVYKINSNNSCVFDLFCGIGFYSLPLSNLFSQVICVDYSMDNINCLEENININNIRNIKCFNLDLFNLHNLKQMNLHIRRYIINLIKNKKYSFYSDLKRKINSIYISMDSKNEVIENFQNIHSPYKSLPNFIYDNLIQWDSKKGAEDFSSNLNEENSQKFCNDNNKNLEAIKQETLGSNGIDKAKCSPSEFVIPFPDIVIINPPRKGCEKIFRRWLRGLCCRFLIYISCNPYSQFRDINHLINLGYVVKEIIPLDSFPRTQHIESVVLLEFDFNKTVDNEKRQIMEFELSEIKSNKRKKYKKG